MNGFRSTARLVRKTALGMRVVVVCLLVLVVSPSLAMHAASDRPSSPVTLAPEAATRASGVADGLTLGASMFVLPRVFARVSAERETNGRAADADVRRQRSVLRL